MSNLSQQRFLFRPEKAQALKQALEASVLLGLEQGLGKPIKGKVNSSTINQTVLEPEGEKFTITLVVTVYPKQEESPTK